MQQASRGCGITVIALFFGSVALFLATIMLLTLYVLVMGPSSWDLRPTGGFVLILTLVTMIACAYTCFITIAGRRFVRWALLSFVLVLATFSIVLSLAPGWFLLY
jgi:hypothetical protein